MTKSLDKYRPVIVNDGWEHTVSDIITLHDYDTSGVRVKERYIEHQDKLLRDELLLIIQDLRLQMAISIRDSR